MMRLAPIAAVLLGLACSGCSAVVYGAVGFALNAVAKGFEIDTAIIDNIKARRAADSGATSISNAFVRQLPAVEK